MIILTGGGIDENAVDAFSMFAKNVQGGTVLYIPLAEDRMTLEENFEWFKNQMLPYGVINIDMITCAEELTKERLNNAKGIFIGGGNAFKLLKELKSCGAYENLKEILKTDKVILGLSAGTTIFGKDINSCLKDDLCVAANDRNKVGLTDTFGFNIFENYSFFVHYKLSEDQFEQTEQKVQRILDLGVNVICLPEETNLIITENEVMVLGRKSLEIVTPNYRKEYQSGQNINLINNNKSLLE